jgi:hypothetical protein
VVGAPEVVVGLGQFADVAAVGVVGEFEGVEALMIVLFEDGDGIVEILEIGPGEEVGNVVLAL